MLMMYLSMVDTQEEKSKFEELYYQYRKLMFVCANNILENELLAEDAVHDAFIKLTGQLTKVSEVKSNRTKRLVIVIVENAAKDIYRKEKYREHISWEKMEGYESGQCNSEMFTETEQAIMALPLTYKHVFQLKYICGYSNAEISSILGITQSAVRKRISRGKDMLAKLLEDMGVNIDEKNTSE